MLLALETATDQCSVVLYDASGVRASRLDTRAREQTRLILPMIEAVLAETGSQFTDLSGIAFSRGPGSFSGVRINAAVAQALAWIHDLPVIPVSTLQALAQHSYAAHGFTQLLAVIDARMNEVYVAAYALENGIMQPQSAEQLAGYDAVHETADLQALVGSGGPLVSIAAYADLPRYPADGATAEDIAHLAWPMLQAGQTVTPDQALPVYLRDDAWKKLDQQGKRD